MKCFCEEELNDEGLMFFSWKVLYRSHYSRRLNFHSFRSSYTLTVFFLLSTLSSLEILNARNLSHKKYKNHVIEYRKRKNKDLRVRCITT